MSRRTRQILLVSTIIGMALLGASPIFAMTDLGTLPGGVTCHGVAINNVGSVAGTCTDNMGQTDAFFKPAGGSIVKLPAVAAGKPCQVVGLTDADVIAGNCESATHGKFVPVVWPAGNPRPAPIVLNPLGNTASAAAVPVRVQKDMRRGLE